MTSITATPTPSTGSPRISTGWLVTGIAATGLVALGFVVVPKLGTDTGTTSTTTSTVVQHARAGGPDALAAHRAPSTVRGPSAVDVERHYYGAGVTSSVMDTTALVPGGSVDDSQVPSAPQQPARAGGPDALAQHHSTAGVLGSSQESLEMHFGTSSSSQQRLGVPKRGYR